MQDIKFDTGKMLLSEMELWGDNPRTISKDEFEKLKASIERKPYYMNARPIVISDRTGQNIVIAGNQRYKAVKALGWKEAPAIVFHCQTEEQEVEIAMVDNHNNGEWDTEMLANKFMDYPLAEWLGSDWEKMAGEFGKVEEVVEDEAPEVNEDDPPVAKLGDVYQLGNHRLMCGDSTDEAQVARLMDGKKADMVFTDPPYGMKKENEGVLNDNLNFNDLLEFNKKWIPLTFDNLKDNGSWYCWGIDEPLMDIYSNILKPMQKNKQIAFRNLITWDKGSGQGQMAEEFRMYPIADEKCLFVMMGAQGFSDNSDNYFEAWEPIRQYLAGEAEKVGLTPQKLKEICGVGMWAHWFSKSQFALIKEEHYRKLQDYYKEKNNDAFKKEYDEIKKEYDEIKKEYYLTRAYFDNTHDNMNNVWHFSKTSRQERNDAGGHATPKPLALCQRAIKSSSRENEAVLDLFGGSGSTLIACEQLGRKCYMMELDPKYCDVIIKRWEKLTGEKAVKLNV